MVHKTSHQLDQMRKQDPKLETGSLLRSSRESRYSIPGWGRAVMTQHRLATVKRQLEAGMVGGESFHTVL